MEFARDFGNDDVYPKFGRNLENRRFRPIGGNFLAPRSR